MMSQVLEDLEQTLHREVPLTAHMGGRVADYDGQSLLLEAALEPNINIHGTAFGGSLYSIAAISCWGLLHLKFAEHALSAHSVLGRAEIEYPLPVRGRIRCRSRLPEAAVFDAFIARVGRGMKASIPVSAEIIADGAVAVSFRGTYSASL